MFEYPFQRLLDNRVDFLLSTSSTSTVVSALKKDALLDKTLAYLSSIPLVVISLVTISYALSHSKWNKSWLLRWTQPFVKEEPLSDDAELEFKHNQPSVIWSIALVILAVLAITLQLIKLLKWGELHLDAIFFVASWSQVILVLILSHPRYCPVWLLAFYFSGFIVELATIQSWTNLRDVEVFAHYATAIVIIVSITIIGVMKFIPVSPGSGPISAVGTFPSSKERSPEDSLRLWQFLSSSWVWPMLQIGKKRQLEKEDVWKLGYGFQNGRVIAAFREVKGSSLFRRLLKANGLDCCILILAALVKLVCRLADPLLLQKLLIAMESLNGRKQTALMYALLILARGVLEAQISSLSLWYSRRCYERTRCELILTVYEKAVSRKVIASPKKPNVTGDTDMTVNGRSGNGQENRNTGESSGIGTNIKSDSPSSIDDMNGANIKKNKAKLKWTARLTILKELFRPTSETTTKSIQHASTGQILNLVRSDANAVARRFVEIEPMVQTPVGTILSIWLLWHLLGWSCLFAVAVAVIAQSLNGTLARVQLRWHRYKKKATDERVQMNSQFIQVIRNLRWYGWEQIWLDKVMASRRHELNVRIVSMLLNIATYMITVYSSAILPVVAFFSYTALAGGQLRIDLIFPALQLISTLNSWLRQIPNVIKLLLNAYVAMGRIEDFLKEPEKEEIELVDDTASLSTNLLELRFSDCSFAWPGTLEPILDKVNLVINPGLTLVYGQIGSGKTALLQAILGEMDKLGGQLGIPKEIIGYHSQKPWLQSLSIRDNILFHSPYDEERYNDVLESCALLPDLASFPNGELSHIGENGIGLSGGQRARVALARAMYSRSRILLLDDPLSALDHQTAESIVSKCFSGALAKDRIIVLVTHRTSLVHHLAGQFVEVSNKTVTVTSEDPFYSDSNADQQDDNSTVHTDEPKPDTRKSNSDEGAEKFIEEERREHGRIKAKVWVAFVRAGKYWWMLLFTMMALSRIANIMQTWFFKSWGEMYSESGTTHVMVTQIPELSSPLVPGGVKSFISLNPIDYLPSPNDNLKPWLILLVVVSLFQASSLSLYAVSQLTAVYSTSKVLFEQAMQTVTGASFRFYDTNPVGRIMNRLTSDIQTLDSALTEFGHTLFFLSMFVSSIIVIASVSPIFLLFSGALMGLFVLVFQQFLPASQSLKRLESVSLSPIYSIFDELLQDQGLSTVRAFHALSSFHDRMVSNIDAYQGFGHFYSSVQNWLMFRYENISSLSMFSLTIIALGTDLSAGLTAFMLINAGNFVSATHTLCMRLAGLQTEFISVERIVELIETEQEPKGTLYPPASWPQLGSEVVFDNVTVRYAPHLDPSLNDISLHIPGGSTTAILGRTGSGKSTLASAILNIVRAETGNITIDNVSLTNIDVHTLRRRITYVPQDPVLFLGPIRQNLDPVNEFTDEECEAILTRVCSRQGWSLETEVESGGKNLSLGQRQLIGIARAVLRRSPIVILDEATASIDIATSIELQNILREELKEATIIVIAHRVEAVQGADYCVVLQNGRVLRQGEVNVENENDQ